MRREVLSRWRAEEEPVTLAKLVEMSGMQRSTVTEASDPAEADARGTGRRGEGSQRKAVHPEDPSAEAEGDGSGEPMPILVGRGTANPRKPTWYAPNREAQRWTWPPRILNSRVLRDEVRNRWSERKSAADDDPFADVPSPGRR